MIIDGIRHQCTSGGCYVPERQCEIDADCPSTAYCASSEGVCRDDGTCLDALDCDLPGNTYARLKCIGYGTCAGGTCGYECGNAQCRDLAGVAFGSCERLLGWAVLGGACTAMSGCGARGHTFFSSESECRASCMR